MDDPGPPPRSEPCRAAAVADLAKSEGRHRTTSDFPKQSEHETVLRPADTYGLGMINSSPKTVARKRAMTPRSRGLHVSRCRAAAMADVAKNESRQKTSSDFRSSLNIRQSLLSGRGLRQRDD